MRGGGKPRPFGSINSPERTGVPAPAPSARRPGVEYPAGKAFSFSVSIEIGMILPTSTPDPARPILGDVRESARFAEEAGLDSVWSTDHVIASAPILDSTVVLATAAAVTGRAR